MYLYRRRRAYDVAQGTKQQYIITYNVYVYIISFIIIMIRDNVIYFHRYLVRGGDSLRTHPQHRICLKVVVRLPHDTII